MFLSDFFLIVDDVDIANYAYDNTIYKEHENIDDLITSLQDAAAKLFKWFSDNQMKGNTDKCHLLLSKDESSEIHTGDSITESSTCKKNYLVLKLIQNFALMTIFKIYVTKLTKNYEH